MITSRYFLDGLDGAGKGSCAEELANILPGNTIIVDYPQYNLPWGKVLKHLLTENDEGLSVEDRMLVYALNRLETVDAIKAQVNSLSELKLPVNIVFDRFFTSNIITAAYYYSKLSPDKRPNDVRTWLLEMYKLMRQIDSEFIEALGLENALVFVPMINESESLSRVLTDTSREGADMYENLSVQSVARQMYLIVANEFPDQIHVFSQYQGDVRMTPLEQARYILSTQPNNTSGSTGGSVRLDSNFEINRDKVKKLLEQFGSEDLKRLDPYPQAES